MAPHAIEMKDDFVMDKLKRMSCPHCGHKFGIHWVFFPHGHKKGFLSTGKECKACKTALCLEGENALVARRIVQIALIPNIVFLALVGGGVVKESLSKGGGVDFIFALLIMAFVIYLFMYASLQIVNAIYIKVLKKDVGYLSLAPDARHVFKNRWYN
jgi:hypothetical protein